MSAVQNASVQAIPLEALLKEIKELSKVDEYLYAKQLSNRELYIEEIVDDSLIYTVVRHIIDWNKEDEGKLVKDRKPITLYINSYGGDVIACFSVVDAIKASKTPVHTVNLGKALSSGGLILMAGHKRFSYKNAVILVHQGYSGASGTSSQVIDQVEFQKRQEVRIQEFILSSTKITEAQYKEKWREEWYTFGDEAVELGIVDELLG